MARTPLLVAACLTLVWCPVSLESTPVADTEAQARAHLKAAREAIGGDARMERIRGLILRGTTEAPAVRSHAASPATVEIRVLFPRSFLRISTSEWMSRASGFVGDHVLQKWTPMSSAVHVSQPGDAEPIVTVQTRWARLMLGILADTRALGPLRLRGGGSANGIYTVEFVGPDDVSTLLDLDERTRVPLRVRYQGEARFPRPRPAGAADSREARDMGPPPPERTELIWSFEDRHVVDGIGLPHRIVESARGVTFEDTHIDTVILNPPLGPNDFQP
jgi:hypothetical protein